MSIELALYFIVGYLIGSALGVPLAHGIIIPLLDRWGPKWWIR